MTEWLLSDLHIHTTFSDGKGFLMKGSEEMSVSVRKVCIKCGGLGAIKKEEEAFRSLGN